MDTFAWTLTLPSRDIPQEDEHHKVVFLAAFWEFLLYAVELFEKKGHSGRMWWVERTDKEIRLQGEIMRLLEDGKPPGSLTRHILISAPVCLTLATNSTAPVWGLIPVVIRALVSQGVIVSPAQVASVECEQVTPVAVGGMDEVRIGLTVHPTGKDKRHGNAPL